MYPHCMIDLETLSTRPDALIVSIGAAPFSIDDVSPTPFRAVLNINAQTDRHIDAGTVAWWMKQSEAARAVFSEQREEVEVVLGHLSSYMDQMCVPVNQRQVWGNGSDFDNVLLRSLYESRGYPVPWRFTGSRCFRTLKNLMQKDYDVIADQVERKVHHDAADDARWQAEVCRRLLALLSTNTQRALNV